MLRQEGARMEKRLCAFFIPLRQTMTRITKKTARKMQKLSLLVIILDSKLLKKINFIN